MIDRAQLLTIAGLLLLVTACAESHLRARDGAIDAQPTSDAAIDAPVIATDAPPVGDGPSCGPNRCRAGEVCCDAECGVCAFEGECGTIACPGP